MMFRIHNAACMTVFQTALSPRQVQVHGGPSTVTWWQ